MHTVVDGLDGHDCREIAHILEPKRVPLSKFYPHEVLREPKKAGKKGTCFYAHWKLGSTHLVHLSVVRVDEKLTSRVGCATSIVVDTPQELATATRK